MLTVWVSYMTSCSDVDGPLEMPPACAGVYARPHGDRRLALSRRPREVLPVSSGTCNLTPVARQRVASINQTPWVPSTVQPSTPLGILKACRCNRQDDFTPDYCRGADSFSGQLWNRNRNNIYKISISYEKYLTLNLYLSQNKQKYVFEIVYEAGIVHAVWISR